MELSLFSGDVETIYIEPSLEHTAEVTIITLPQPLSFHLSTKGCLKLARDLLAEAMKMGEDDEILDAWGIIDERLKCQI